MSHQAYPDISEAMQAAKDLVAAWRDGSMLTDRAKSAWNVWTLTGYGLGATFGPPEHPLIGTTMATDGQPLSEDQLMSQLESFGSSDPSLKTAIPWPLIMAALKLLLERLMKE